ncbi:D-alanyl-D-alanine carboxypeptidase family protein [Paenibacillus sp. Leaf72]|uniref:D-alanyl-D-alanine carboxypeptidase family protein n=1 Tax=Paenibacillus sp. Leaf72 TaxID=1736234 RepID=UPI0006F3F464|nr:D-alanyl-D-alanine carboxypeptidase family protein [Paenibacillus sp. Leaf72]KQO17460.1 D-alanyl-D-alanine carboxypeptidase [Paenibacillus sp. Leaf72]
MKKLRNKLCLCILALAVSLPTAVFAAEAAETPLFPSLPAAEQSGSAEPHLAPSARSAILMDADSGTIIYEKNSHDQLPPASITKIMTMLLIMEALADGKLKLTDKVQTSEYASSMGGSQIFLEPGEEMTVDDMIKGIALASGNDASVAMAEKLGGTEEQFVAMMNEKAKQLGLKETHFANCNGLPSKDHYSSAHDIAVMSRELLKHTNITKYTGMYQDYLRKTSEKPFWLVNTNKLVRFYSGADGLKTGFTNEAKFCLSATARRDGLRIIAVVMGEPNTKTRNTEVSQMFDYAFAQYMTHPIIKEGDAMGKVHVEKGVVSELELVAPHAYSVLLKKGANTSDIRYELKIDGSLKAPVAIGAPIGKLLVYQGDKLLKEFPVDAPQTIERAGWWKMLKRSFGGLFA